MKLSVISLLTGAALAAASPLSLEPRQESIVWPHRTYRWFVHDGSFIDDPQDQLLVVKDNVPEHESTTLATFDIASDLEGRTCKLILDLWDRDVSTGTQTADVFTSVNPGNRGQHVGRVYLPKPGSAEWIFSYHGLPTLPCPAGELTGF
ncbi:hypothetical protein BDW62DRAFT_216485 [Aspergillus aurantiobrunneus]